MEKVVRFQVPEPDAAVDVDLGEEAGAVSEAETEPESQVQDAVIEPVIDATEEIAGELHDSDPDSPSVATSREGKKFKWDLSHLDKEKQEKLEKVL